MHEYDRSGSTATCVLCDESRLIIGNLGDSRAVLCLGGTALPLTVDATPACPDEHARLLLCDQIVSSGRLGGSLGVSRALGDRYWKMDARTGAMLADAELSQVELGTDDSFLLIASDGLFKCCNNDTAVAHVRQFLNEASQPLTSSALDAAARSLVPALQSLDTHNNNAVISSTRRRGQSSWGSSSRSGGLGGNTASCTAASTALSEPRAWQASTIIERCHCWWRRMCCGGAAPFQLQQPPSITTCRRTCSSMSTASAARRES
eukprot:TRINITY_DN490_c0_g2_i1.p2 TRINITY_DN490_c0_g2~~TRINITY_DN490_c0_g2_i1.p2  ORF type:complete len:263 (+),score=28.30 TRINITY_DN490_c0_g2_i1:388-1176(+)